MCGRYTFQNNKTIKEKHNIEVTPNYNVCPSTKVPVLSSQLNFMHWGYTPNWAKTPMNIINARYETIKDKPMFKTMKRCIMIMDGWYEWSRQFNWKRREKKKLLITTTSMVT